MMMVIPFTLDNVGADGIESAVSHTIDVERHQIAGADHGRKLIVGCGDNDLIAEKRSVLDRGDDKASVPIDGAQDAGEGKGGLLSRCGKGSEEGGRKQEYGQPSDMGKLHFSIPPE